MSQRQPGYKYFDSIGKSKIKMTIQLTHPSKDFNVPKYCNVLCSNVSNNFSLSNMGEFSRIREFWILNSGYCVRPSVTRECFRFYFFHTKIRETSFCLWHVTPQKKEKEERVLDNFDWTLLGHKKMITSHSQGLRADTADRNRQSVDWPLKMNLLSCTTAGLPKSFFWERFFLEFRGQG